MRGLGNNSNDRVITKEKCSESNQLDVETERRTSQNEKTETVFVQEDSIHSECLNTNKDQKEFEQVRYRDLSKLTNDSKGSVLPRVLVDKKRENQQST